jgi:hypothetical protein
MVQPNGDQSRKVLGELCAPGQPPVVTLTVTEMGVLQTAAGGKEKGQTAELPGVLEVGPRKVPVKVVVNFRHHGGKGDEKNTALMLEGRGTLKAADLGLKALAPDAAVEVRMGLTAYPPQVTAAPRK